MIKEIIVVEGKSDTAAVKHAVNAETIETGGSAINEEIYEQIELAYERRGVIIFTDPDHAGERLRRLITERIPGCKHAFLERDMARNKEGKIGIEHASPEAIREALSCVKPVFQEDDFAAGVEWSDLLAAGLIGTSSAAGRRAAVGKLLGIGYANGKQFFKRCQMFQIGREEFAAAVSAAAAAHKTVQNDNEGRYE
ncbi:ribonuclease M5 [Paenibacillus senegalensis]|uniref:ribonuclease M5 n=1 Tax=Paenibacillus senegalensis TaxID=1465766 RepID=UPI000288C033|nr:ribonuclease M5 [Paenibacillus senegalensis]